MKATKTTTSLWDFYAIISVVYIGVAWCHLCDKTLILRNIGYEFLRGGRGGGTPATQATINSEMTTPHPHLPRPVICQQCSMGPEATQQHVVRGGSAPRGQVQPLTLGRGTPLKTLFSLCRSLWLGELASILQGFYRDRDTQLRFPPNYIKKAF